ncbi:MAG: DUF427 domain-containing protein [Chloroflexota bacterium]|jgi:uncharacterized protein (DUF427 family)
MTTPQPIGGPDVRAKPVPPPADRVVPGPGQESVWDYPRPPRVEPVLERVRVVVDGVTIADSERALRVLETAGAPVYYFPLADVRLDLLQPSGHGSVCEWKGDAISHSIAVPGRIVKNAGWSYPDPKSGYEAIRDHLAFYVWRVDEAWVGDERATPQPGRFYGGWVTSRVVGPLKGGPGTFGW